MTEIYPSSDKAKERALINRNAVEKYPFSKLEVGQSFQVGFKEILQQSLRNQASRVGRKLDRKFVVILHSEEAGYEVARIK